MKKYIKYWPLAVLLILVLTNPSTTAFKDYVGSNSYKGIERRANFFVFSTFRYQGNRYYGFLGNFLDCPASAQVDRRWQQSAGNRVEIDTQKMDQKYDEYGIPIRKKH